MLIRTARFRADPRYISAQKRLGLPLWLSPARTTPPSPIMRSAAEPDAWQSRVVELRFFGGLTIEGSAEVLKVSPATVMRDGSLARAWLRREVASTINDSRE
jgi:DNA-directed RNA polymerase specialized sigma24 family protein